MNVIHQNNLKKQAAASVLEFISDNTIGVGTGSTVNYFIDSLAQIKEQIRGVVSSSDASTERLKKYGIPIFDLNITGELDLYIDGTDEVNARLELIKGGGGALTREKIIAAASKRFICIADESKLVEVLGRFPLPVEVIPMARNQVARELVRLGGTPIWREGFITDNGNCILDVHHLAMFNPIEIEDRINQITGVVTVGIFARRPADLLILGTTNGPKILERVED